MATIRIKRTSTSNRPGSLANSELAMIEGSNTLVIGVGTGGEGGSATSIVDVGGTGAFLGLSNSLTQTAAGNYTFSGTATFSGTTELGAATATSPSLNDDSTRVATTAWVQDEIAALGAGSVTSVGLSLPNIFTITNSPVTTSGSLSADLANQNANQVFAGPSTGSPATPTFRSLVAADIPDLSATYLTVTAASQTYLTANQNITLSGDATGSGATAITVTVANDAITNAKLANMATGTIKGRKTTETGDPEDLSASDVKTLLDFDASVQASRLDQMAAPTSAVSMNGQKITNVAAPTEANDAATKAYVDAARSGLDVKASVRAATTENITLSGEQSIDGVSVASGDRVLVKNQSTGSQNGIYVCAVGSWTRAADADSDAEVTSGLFTFVEEGTANADSGWVLTTDGSITVGTTSLSFAQFSGAGQVTAGDGLVKSGNTLNVVGTADRITANADSIDIASTYAGQNSIVTVGTLTSGSLGTGFTAVGVAQGGLGLTSAVSGLLKGAAGAYSAAVAGTDYLDPNSTIDGGTF